MDAVSADQDIALGLAVVFEAQQHRISRGINPNATLIKLDCVGRKRAAQMRMQIRALHLINGAPKRSRQALRVADLKSTRPLRQLHDVMLGHCAEARNAILEIEGAQHLHGVWTKLDTGADITERARLLIYRSLEAGPAHRDRGNEPAKPGTMVATRRSFIAPPTCRGRS